MPDRLTASHAAGSSISHARGGDPRERACGWLDSIDATEPSLLQVDFELTAPWLDGAPTISLTALYLASEGRLQVAVTDQSLQFDGLGPVEQFSAWVNRYCLFVARPEVPLPLCPLEIVKPWGRELWFSGVERRGVCEFGHGAYRTPQPWLLAALPGVSGSPPYRTSTLLKVLEPLAAPVAGDLYFELHDVKQEVYVVTDVDRRAWPDGVGRLRFGFCPQRVASSASEEQFRRDYLDTVLAYRDLRERLDALSEDDPAAVELSFREQALRAAMEEFILFRPVRVGDVIEVPPKLPHGLLHGVTVVEFQTPVFERKILSSAQPVVTQAHWDTEEAVAGMRLTAPCEQTGSASIEHSAAPFDSVANPDGFEVRRLTLRAGKNARLSTGKGDALMIVLQGEVSCDAVDFGPREAGWMPPEWQGELAVAAGGDEAVLLLALTRP